MKKILVKLALQIAKNLASVQNLASVKCAKYKNATKTKNALAQNLVAHKH